MGIKDIAMMNAVTDVSGLDTISRDVFGNPARAIAGMAHGDDHNAPAEKPLVLITTLGTTEASVRRVRQAWTGWPRPRTWRWCWTCRRRKFSTT